LKRLEAGENVFRRLEENYNVLDSLIVQAAKQRDAIAIAIPKHLQGAAKRKRVTKRPPATIPGVPSHFVQHIAVPIPHAPAKAETENGTGAVIAAAALCQLSSVGGWEPNHSLQKSC
jgi:hypothetical protein